MPDKIGGRGLRGTSLDCQCGEPAITSDGLAGSLTRMPARWRAELLNAQSELAAQTPRRDRAYEKVAAPEPYYFRKICAIGHARRDERSAPTLSIQRWSAVTDLGPRPNAAGSSSMNFS
jgi:hypothetical protein